MNHQNRPQKATMTSKISDTPFIEQLDGGCPLRSAWDSAPPVTSSANTALPPMPTDLAAGATVAVAMSGGVDSSVVAAVLAEQGFKVIGITLQLYDHGQALGKKGACCAGADIYDARQVADRLNIPHYVLDYESRFNQAVIQDFADAYARGETPIPCVRCNQRVKFKDLLEMARDLGAQALATGHYVQRLLGDSGQAQLHRAADHNRDQSYFLFATTQAQLDFLRFPLGGLASKDETRALAARYGLAVADKPDSQDICFVPTGGYADVVARLRPEAVEPGDIIHLDGRVMGRHQGIIHYTIGQRKGLGIGGQKDGDNEPLFVIRLDAARRQVVVGARQDLRCQQMRLTEVNWLGDAAPGGIAAVTDLAVAVKWRSMMNPVAARLSLTAPSGTDTQAIVTLDNADDHGAIAPGQACVFYQGERVLGGGWIQGTSLDESSATRLS